MSLRVLSFALLGLGFVAAGATPAIADREPNANERARIEQTLRGAGYVVWDDIEFDDGVWEVDDARRSGGSPECDVKISPTTYEILEEDCD
jgi:hypothetical protein